MQTGGRNTAQTDHSTRHNTRHSTDTHHWTDTTQHQTDDNIHRIQHTVQPTGLPVLLINHSQPQLLELEGVSDEGMGAHYDADAAVS